MQKNQRRLSVGLLLLVLVLTVIPTIYILKYGKQVLFEWNLLPPESLPVPFSITATQDVVSASATPELNEKEKAILTSGLQLIFNAHANNLAYYFKYFSIVEFGHEEIPSAFVFVFSSQPPKVGIENGIKKVNWVGQRINFDIIQRRMLFVSDGVFEFIGQQKLSVRVFYSSSLEPDKIEQSIDPKKTLPSEKF
jgi:hypothetical protein